MASRTSPEGGRWQRHPDGSRAEASSSPSLGAAPQPAASPGGGRESASRSTHHSMTIVDETSDHICRGEVRSALPQGPGRTQAPWRVARSEPTGKEPCGKGDWGCPKDSSPPLKQWLPSLEEHVSRTDGWLKLALPQRPGVELTPLGPLSLYGPGCTGGA